MQRYSMLFMRQTVCICKALLLVWPLGTASDPSETAGEGEKEVHLQADKDAPASHGQRRCCKQVGDWILHHSRAVQLNLSPLLKTPKNASV